MAGEMGLAILAPEDLVGVEVDVVGEPHPCRSGDRSGGEADGGRRIMDIEIETLSEAPYWNCRSIWQPGFFVLGSTALNVCKERNALSGKSNKWSYSGRTRPLTSILRRWSGVSSGFNRQTEFGQFRPGELLWQL